MTVQENVELPAIFHNILSDNGISKRALELLEILGIKDKAKQKPSNLSGGEQQRVAIARALMNRPVLILADEPTGNLDTRTGREVFQMLRTLSKKFGTAIIMVTHNLELALLTDRSIYIRDGKIEKQIINDHAANTNGINSTDEKVIVADIGNDQDSADTSAPIYEEQRIGYDKTSCKSTSNAGIGASNH